MSTTSVPDITVLGGDSPSDELLEQLADLLLDLSEEPSDQGGGYGGEGDRIGEVSETRG